MNIVIVGPFPFPTGSASAARIRNFALGFRDCGMQVHVLAMAPTQTHPLSSKKRTLLEFEGITYERMAVFERNKYGSLIAKLRWFLGLYGSIWSTYWQLNQLINEGKCDLFLSYGRSAILQWPLVKLCKQHNIPTVLDVTEIAESFSAFGGRLNPIYWDQQLGTKYMPLHFDIISAITRDLEKRHKILGCKQVIVIPSIEDWSNLIRVEPKPLNNNFQLVYVGALIDRDSPDLLLDALKILRLRGMSVQLDVIGRFQKSPEGRKRAARILADPLLQTCVNLVGEISDEELTNRLYEADGLVLLRRNAATEISSFPTRLVEYLRQGRPVFVSDVGDISIYLRHERDALLLSPHDPTQVADTIQAVMASPDRGYTIGIQGRLSGAKYFDRQVHARRLLDIAASVNQE